MCSTLGPLRPTFPGASWRSSWIKARRIGAGLRNDLVKQGCGRALGSWEQTFRDQLVRRTESLRWRFRIGHRFGGGQTSSCLLGGAAAAEDHSSRASNGLCLVSKRLPLTYCSTPPSGAARLSVVAGVVSGCTAPRSVEKNGGARQGARQGTHHPRAPSITNVTWPPPTTCMPCRANPTQVPVWRPVTAKKGGKTPTSR